MSVLFFLMPIALALGLFFLLGFLFAARSGQLSDLETPAYRALIDETERNPRKGNENGSDR